MMRTTILTMLLALSLPAHGALPSCGPNTPTTDVVIIDRPPTPDEIAATPNRPPILMLDHLSCKGPDFKWIVTSTIPQFRN